MLRNPPWRRSIGTLAVATLAVLTIAYAGGPMFTNDAFWHVATGRYLIEAGGFPATDPFSFTATGERWVLHEWLTQVVFATIHAVAGMGGLRVLTALCTAAALGLVAALFRRELGAPGVLIGVVAFVALCWPRLQTRPTLFTILAILALVTLWTRRGRRWRTRDGVCVVALQVAWTNAHSVALLGPVLYAVFVAGLAIETRLARRGARGFPAPEPGELRRHATTLVGCALATLATPAGLHLWEFAWQDKSSVMQYVDDEWAPFHLAYADNLSLPFETWLGVVATIAVVLVTWIALGAALNREGDKLRSAMLPAPTRVLLALAFFAGGLTARRFHWLHVLTLVLCLQMLAQVARAGGLGAAVTRAVYGARARSFAAALAVVAAIALGVGTLRVEGRSVAAAVTRADYWTRPIAAAFALDGVDFLADSGIEGDVVCHYGSGGILSYRGFPALRVLIDSRIDLYRRAIYLDYVAIRDGRPDQQALLDRYGADVYFRHWELGPPVDRQAWVPVWEGDDGEVLLRRGAPRTAANTARARAWHAARGLAGPTDRAAAPR